MGSFHLKGVCTAAWVPAIDLALGKRALWKPIFLTEPGRGEIPLVTTPHLEGRWQGCWQAHLGPLLSSANGREALPCPDTLVLESHLFPPPWFAVWASPGDPQGWASLAEFPLWDGRPVGHPHFWATISLSATSWHPGPGSSLFREQSWPARAWSTGSTGCF